MPTNKLWLEHTERAAWDSVQALREKLTRAEERLARFAPAAENWKHILDALDGARAELGASDAAYGAVAEKLVEELARIRLRLEEAERELSALRKPSPSRGMLNAAPPPARDLSFVSDGDHDPVGRTLRALSRRLESTAVPNRSRQKDIDNAVAAVERRLDELDDAPASERAELALELATAAVRLCILQRVRRGDRESQD